MSPHPGADGLVQGVPARLQNFDRFHQPCLLPGRTSKIGVDSRPVPRGDNFPLRRARSSSLLSQDGTTAGRLFALSTLSSHACRPVTRCLHTHTQVRIKVLAISIAVHMRRSLTSNLFGQVFTTTRYRSVGTELADLPIELCGIKSSLFGDFALQ